jgi:hypothetical protein
VSDDDRSLEPEHTELRYQLRLIAWRDPAQRLREIRDTLDQIIEAYEQIGIDRHTLELALQGAEARLLERDEKRRRNG